MTRSGRHDAPFATTPVPMILWGAASSPYFLSSVGSGAASMSFQVRNAAGAVIDPETGFYFMAVQRF
ncbi:MAG TPA: hypothetical protein PLB01_08765 [Thermoanaerobaculia bacterium]|nr:hypothetical protein [Thermoanaerobaculia bacterium]